MSSQINCIHMAQYHNFPQGALQPVQHMTVLNCQYGNQVKLPPEKPLTGKNGKTTVHHCTGKLHVGTTTASYPMLGLKPTVYKVVKASVSHLRR